MPKIGENEEKRSFYRYLFRVGLFYADQYLMLSIGKNSSVGRGFFRSVENDPAFVADLVPACRDCFFRFFCKKKCEIAGSRTLNS